MIGLLQRVSSAQVSINNKIVAKIGTGLLVLIGIEKGDTRQQADRLLDKILAYRIFPDKEGKMNLSLTELNHGLLLVPQFTLPADTKKGMRPSFSSAASPELGGGIIRIPALMCKTETYHCRFGSIRYGHAGEPDE